MLSLARRIARGSDLRQWITGIFIKPHGLDWRVASVSRITKLYPNAAYPYPCPRAGMLPATTLRTGRAGKLRALRAVSSKRWESEECGKKGKGVERNHLSRPSILWRMSRLTTVCGLLSCLLGQTSDSGIRLWFSSNCP